MIETQLRNYLLLPRSKFSFVRVHLHGESICTYFVNISRNLVATFLFISLPLHFYLDAFSTNILVLFLYLILYFLPWYAFISSSLSPFFLLHFTSPCHLVVVKGTEFFDGKLGRYVDCPVTDVLQMMGRAGRPVSHRNHLYLEYQAASHPVLSIQVFLMFNLSNIVSYCLILSHTVSYCLILSHIVTYCNIL